MAADREYRRVALQEADKYVSASDRGNGTLSRVEGYANGTSRTVIFKYPSGRRVAIKIDKKNHYIWGGSVLTSRNNRKKGRIFYP